MSDQTTTEHGPQSPISPDGPQSPIQPDAAQSPQSPQSPQAQQPPQSPQSPGGPQSPQEPQSAAAEAPKPRSESCPKCGAPAEPGQMACLSCGTRLDLRYRKPPSWRVPAAIVAGVLLLLVIGGGFAIREIASEAEIESTKEAAPTAEEQAAQNQPPGEATGPDAATPVSPGEDSQPPEASPSTPPAEPEPAAPARPTTIQEWPPGESGWTAVLVSHESRAGAQKRARDALKVGIPAGVLRSGDFSSLKPGFWVVFAGRTPSQAKAQQMAKGYAGKGFPGAYARAVKD